MAMNYWLSFSPNTFLSSPDADCCMCYAMENDYEELAVETEAKEPQTVSAALRVAKGRAKWDRRTCPPSRNRFLAVRRQRPRWNFCGS